MRCPWTESLFITRTHPWNFVYSFWYLFYNAVRCDKFSYVGTDYITVRAEQSYKSVEPTGAECPCGFHWGAPGSKNSEHDFSSFLAALRTLSCRNVTGFPSVTSFSILSCIPVKYGPASSQISFSSTRWASIMSLTVFKSSWRSLSSCSVFLISRRCASPHVDAALISTPKTPMDAPTAKSEPEAGRLPPGPAPLLGPSLARHSRLSSARTGDLPAHTRLLTNQTLSYTSVHPSPHALEQLWCLLKVSQNFAGYLPYPASKHPGLPLKSTFGFSALCDTVYVFCLFICVISLLAEDGYRLRIRSRREHGRASRRLHAQHGLPWVAEVLRDLGPKSQAAGGWGSFVFQFFTTLTLHIAQMGMFPLFFVPHNTQHKYSLNICITSFPTGRGLQWITKCQFRAFILGYTERMITDDYARSCRVANQSNPEVLNVLANFH